MIAIRVCGTGSNRRLKKLLYDVSHFYLHKLMPRKRVIQIKIQVVRDLATTENVFGDCYQCYSGESDEDYIIRLDYNESYRAMMITLAHEFVHLKQYDRKELIFYAKNHDRAKWKNVLYDNYDYETAPWEIEANSMEHTLYTSFLESRRKL